MLSPNNLYHYQRQAIMHQLTHDDSMLWLQMGLGKTTITLTTIVDRMRAGQVEKTLIFGPLRVIQAVWAREARKWTHTQHLRFSVIHGTKEQRTRALFADADIYLINYEAMNWLAETLDHYYYNDELPFQMVVYDECSKLKNSTTLRMAGGKRDKKDGHGDSYSVKVTGWRKMIDKFQYRTGLTGTPASNGYLDLFGQFLAVDGGQRLGPYVTGYKDNYFVSDYNGWAYTPSEKGKEWIEHKISDITLKMDSADYLDLPVSKVIDVMVDLPPKARTAYNKMEKEMFAALDNGDELEVFSKSSVSNKLLQIANGSPYLSAESDDFTVVHAAKLDALADVLEEAGGSPVLCSYSFKADAKQIMKKFKKYRPVNLTDVPSRDTEKIINKWNRGEIKLLIGHPACLHPDTQVLTDVRGWVKLIDVELEDKVFDGVEFVSHSGCSYSGYKEVVDLFGVTMTPDHKLLIDHEWVEAAGVRDCQDIRGKASYEYQGDDEYLSSMLPVQDGVKDTPAECNQAQSNEEGVLSELRQGQVSQSDRGSHLEDMAGDEESIKGSLRQKLRRSWNRYVRGMGDLSKLLHRYVTGLQRRPDYRACRCEQELFKGELCVGSCLRSAGEQANHPSRDLSRHRDAPGRVVPFNRGKQDNAPDEIKQRDVRRRSGRGCDQLSLWEKYGTKERIKKEQAHVYDLVNCGPRHRFLIRNDNGEVFISHNSMGHGVDGLQDSGSILVWFGMNWSLELYEQMCKRLDRQGQKKPVSIIRILCNQTVDLAVVDAIERKTDNQEGLKAAIQRYRGRA